jgi:hypothetical protein
VGGKEGWYREGREEGGRERVWFELVGGGGKGGLTCW